MALAWLRRLLGADPRPDPASGDPAQETTVTATLDLIVGLGNPGPDYEQTRHNAGYWFVDELARRNDGRFAPERKFHGDVARLSIGRHDIRVLKPTTFMNRSGQSVRAMAAFFKIPPERILVVHDDIDLPPGTVRLKRGGGHGGNNGLRDCIAHLGPDFARLRLGVGHPGNRDDVVDYVLRRPGKADAAAIEEAIDKGLAAMPMLLGQGFERAMHKLHSGKKKKKNKPESPPDDATKTAD